MQDSPGALAAARRLLPKRGLTGYPGAEEQPKVERVPDATLQPKRERCPGVGSPQNLNPNPVDQKPIQDGVVDRHAIPDVDTGAEPTDLHFRHRAWLEVRGLLPIVFLLDLSDSRRGPMWSNESSHS